MTFSLLIACAIAAVPQLPASNGTVSIAAQEWPLEPGSRWISVGIYYPKSDIASVSSETGLMLCLHNWGGTGAIGAPDPIQVAKRYNVIAITVDYLQSGKWDPKNGKPYDFGYLQALDALRGLHYVFDSLKRDNRPFARGRIYACGGSGGGNVSLMANKLAPRTFACIVDISGMAKLSDDIAFGLPGGSDLNAAYSNVPQTRNFLSPDAQEIRFVANPDHMETMNRLGNSATIVVVHGNDDTTCPIADVREMIGLFMEYGLNVAPHIVADADIDGVLFKDSKHSLGDRTNILFKFADPFLLPSSREMCVRNGENDFELRDESVRYRTSEGEYVISYKYDAPTGRFVADDSVEN